MTSIVHSLRRRTLVVGLAVASLAGAGGALASLESGSDYAEPEIMQLGYGPGGAPSASVRTFSELPEREAVRCDVPVGASHPIDLWRCE
jgi:hypothetical protein